MTPKTSWLFAKLVLLFFPAIAGAQTNPCADYLNKLSKVSQLRTEIGLISQQLTSTSLTLAYKNQLKETRGQLTREFQNASAEAAKLLALCPPTTNSQEVALTRNYQMAHHYINALDCGAASNLLQECRRSSVFNIHRVNNQPVNKNVEILSRLCQAPTKSLKESMMYIYIHAKGLYFPLDRVDSADNRPYTADELEAFSSRILTKEEADTSLRGFKEMSVDGVVFYRFPFVLVAGPGKYKYNAVVPEKSLPLSERVNPQDNDSVSASFDHNRLQSLAFIYEKIVNPYYEHLKHKYFDSVKFDFVLPIYLAGGDFKQRSYEEFVAFSRRVHFRSAGPRVAYYSPYDRSIIAWMPTGGGTLIHELVHALIDNEFPNAPVWISEGLASLHEEVDAKTITPKDNYRLAYVESAKSVFGCHMPLKAIVGLTSESVNNDKSGMLNSAYARYFSLYLENEGVLGAFYRKIRESGDLSPGKQLQILSGVMGSNLQTIQFNWEQWLSRRQVPSKWQSLRPGIYNYIWMLKSEKIITWACAGN